MASHMDDQRTDREGGQDFAERKGEIERYKEIVKTLHVAGWFGILGASSCLYMASAARPMNYLFGATMLCIAAYMHYRAFVGRRRILKAESELKNNFHAH